MKNNGCLQLLCLTTTFQLFLAVPNELCDQAKDHRANMQGHEDLQKPKGPITRENMQGHEDLQKPKEPITRTKAKRIEQEQAMQSLVVTHGSTNMTGEDKITSIPLLTTC